MAHGTACARQYYVMPATPVCNARHIFRPKADPLEGAPGMHDESRRHVIFGLKEMFEFVALSEVYRERQHHTVRCDEQRSAISPVRTARVDRRDQPFDMIGKHYVVILGIGHVAAAGLAKGNIAVGVAAEWSLG